MSIRLTYYIDSGTWAETIAPETPAPMVEIGVKGGEYDGLRFGIVAISGGRVVANVNYPPQGVTYVTSDQSYLTSLQLNGCADSVSLFLWVESGGVRSEHSVIVELPAP